MELLERIPVPTPVLQWAGFAAVLLGLGSLVVMPLLVIAIPHDHFVTRAEPALPWGYRHPALRFLWRVARNTLGAILVLLGIAMLVLPGQGVLTILVGLVLLEFPGKRQLELKIVRRRRILASLNWIRAKANRPPLLLPPPMPRKRRRRRRRRRGRGRGEDPATQGEGVA